MLVLRRKPGQWVELTHVASGERCRIHLDRHDGRGVDLGFEDADRRFDFQRPERKPRPVVPFPPETPPTFSNLNGACVNAIDSALSYLDQLAAPPEPFDLTPSPV